MKGSKGSEEDEEERGDEKRESRERDINESKDANACMFVSRKGVPLPRWR